MDYFDYGSQRRRTSVTRDRLNAPLPGRPLSGVSSRESLRTPGGTPSIRIRRLPSSNAIEQAPSLTQQQEDERERSTSRTGRRRSSSAPQRHDQLVPPENAITRQRTAEPHMPSLNEGVATEKFPDVRPGAPDQSGTSPVQGSAGTDRLAGGAQAMHSAGNAARGARGLRRFRSSVATPQVQQGQGRQSDQDEYASEVVDLLDLVDPEVSTISTLTNMQNSLFVPDMGRWLNRRPTYELSQRPTGLSRQSTADRKVRDRASTVSSTQSKRRHSQGNFLETINQEQTDLEDGVELDRATSRASRMSISSQLSENRYAVLPHGVTLEGWTEEDKLELNDHVRHLLHSRREGFKRSMRGFRQYISKPLGLFVTIYAFLVTLFGLVWVLFLIGWISGHGKQDYDTNVIDNVLVALFALIGDGMAPFRMVDTYHMCFIAHYHHLTWRLRREKNLPKLPDHNDLPPQLESEIDLEAAIDKEEMAEVSVLNAKQQERLKHHQTKFSKSHTFYKPHETSTHHAFPLRLLVAVVVLLDCHSLFQIALGTCTWSIYYKHRPQALTATILSCSITCNIVAGVLISIGDKRTRKKDVMERIFRQALTEEAIHHIAKKTEKKKSMSTEEDSGAPEITVTDQDDYHPGYAADVNKRGPAGSSATQPYSGT